MTTITRKPRWCKFKAQCAVKRHERDFTGNIITDGITVNDNICTWSGKVDHYSYLHITENKHQIIQKSNNLIPDLMYQLLSVPHAHVCNVIEKRCKKGSLKILEVWKGGPEKFMLILPLKIESKWISVGLTPILLAEIWGSWKILPFQSEKFVNGP